MQEQTRHRIIEISGAGLNAIKLAMIVNKRLKRQVLANFDYIGTPLLLNSKQTLLQNLVCDTTYCQCSSTYELMQSLSTAKQGRIKEFLSFLPPILNNFSQLTNRQSLYYLMIKLLLKQSPTLIIDTIDFADEFHAAHLFLELLKNFKANSSIYLHQQDNILATMATTRFICVDGELKEVKPSNSQYQKVELQQESKHTLLLPAVIPTINDKKIAS